MTTATIYIERNGICDIPVLVTGTYHKGFRGTREEPPEQAYVELESAVVVSNVFHPSSLTPMLYGNMEIELTQAEQTRAEEALYEAAQDDLESDAEAAAEARARRLEEDL